MCLAAREARRAPSRVSVHAAQISVTSEDLQSDTVSSVCLSDGLLSFSSSLGRLVPTHSVSDAEQ